MGLPELKIFYIVKAKIIRGKRQAIKWEKIFANYIFYKGLISKMDRELLQLNSKNKITQLKLDERLLKRRHKHIRIKTYKFLRINLMQYQQI